MCSNSILGLIGGFKFEFEFWFKFWFELSSGSSSGSGSFLKGHKKMEEKNEELLTNFGATRWSIWAERDRERPGEIAGHRWALLGTFVLILQLVLGTANHAQSSLCSWETRIIRTFFIQ